MLWGTWRFVFVRDIHVESRAFGSPLATRGKKYMSENKGYAHPETLVDADWVQAHLADPSVRLIEVDVDTTAYEQGHIPGAVGFNWQRELQDQVMRAPVSKEQLEALLGRAGVSNDTSIVLYGDNNNWFAAWAFWILKYYGPPNYSRY
jgi:thiosulfate/3-mercaptopyruvate sulfurtransferase